MSTNKFILLRYIAIVYPLRPRMSKCIARIAISLIWLASCILAVPCLLYSQTISHRCVLSVFSCVHFRISHLYLCRNSQGLSFDDKLDMFKVNFSFKRYCCELYVEYYISWC